MSQKVYLWILKTGVVLSFICVFFVFRNFLFPYITSKQISFNVLVEVLFVFWLAFIIKFPQWNPFKGFTKTWPVRLFVKEKKPLIVEVPQVTEINNKNYKKNNIVEPEKIPAINNKDSQLITFGMIAFFSVILISCFTGVDFHMSFWSNAERMLGVFHILHFFVLFLIAVTVFRDWNDWKIAFFGLLLAAVGVSFGSMPAGSEAYSYLGNSLYTAIFMIFAFFFSLILFFHKEGSDNKKGYPVLRWFYFLALPFLYFQFAKVNKAGDTVGLLMGVAAFVFLFGVISKRRALRIASWIVALSVVGLIVSALVFHANPIIANNRFLSRINTNRATFQTRLLSWESGVKDFHNHVWLGTGFGNYAIIFDKYFQAKFYDYTKTETYFDRAHNNVVDLTSTTGVLGILAYLSILAAAGVYLIRIYRRGRIKPIEFCLLCALLVAYFVQNLDVFDSFVSYMCLMITLGYIHWLANTTEDAGNTRALIAIGGDKGFPDREIFALIAGGLVSTFLIYNYAILPVRTYVGVIEGQGAFGAGQIVTGAEIYKEALANNTPLDRDSRSMLERAVVQYAWDVSKLNQADAANVINLAIEYGLKDLAYNPADSMAQMQIAQLYDVGYKIINDPTVHAADGQASIDHINKAIDASPQRIPVYFLKAQMLIGQDKIDEAITTLETAAKISSTFYDTNCQLAQVYLIKQNELSQDKAAAATVAAEGAKAWPQMDICLANGGVSNLVISEVIKESINHYGAANNVDNVIALLEQLVQYESSVEDYKNLAQLYVQKGEIDKAISAYEKISTIDPSLKKDVDSTVKKLQINN
jgi:O-antigen ligase/tetratricopeptide (TPR) repeat protein